MEADAYLMVDGDGTYPPGAASALLRLVLAEGAEMAVGSRWHELSDSRGRAANLCGNRLFRYATNVVFGTRLTDVLSGYRALSKDFVDRARLGSTGFEVEMELTVKSLAGGGLVGARSGGGVNQEEWEQEGDRGLLHGTFPPGPSSLRTRPHGQRN